jgi:hypothetical protein
MKNSWFWIFFTIFQLIKIITFWAPFSPLEKSGKKNPIVGILILAIQEDKGKFKFSKNIFLKKSIGLRYIQVSKNSNPGQVVL